MAIDTAAKRFSMMGMANPTIKMIITDGVSGVNAGERATFIDVYSGIALSNPSGFQVAWANSSNVMIQGGIA